MSKRARVAEPSDYTEDELNEIRSYLKEYIDSVMKKYKEEPDERTPESIDKIKMLYRIHRHLHSIPYTESYRFVHRLSRFNDKPKIKQALDRILDLSVRHADEAVGWWDEPACTLTDNCEPCPICFENIESSFYQCEACSQCGKKFHTECIQIWNKSSHTCPNCRNNYVPVNCVNYETEQIMTQQDIINTKRKRGGKKLSEKKKKTRRRRCSGKTSRKQC